MSIQFGIIGPGRIADRRFCEGIGLVEEAHLLAVASKSYDRAAAFAQKHGISKAFGSYEEMLADPEIEAVYIATTHNFHYENIMLCLQYGKHVLCEKSMMTNAADAKSAFSYAKEKGLLLVEGMWLAHLPAVGKVKKLLNSGAIGDVVFASSVLGFKADNNPDDRFLSKALGGGAAFDLSVYNIELAFALFGTGYKKVSTAVRFGCTGVDVADNILLDYGSFAVDMQSTLDSNPPNGEFIISGTKGSIRIDGFVWAKKVTLKLDGCEPEVFEFPFENGFQFEITDMCACIKQGRTTSVVVPPEMTIKCAEIYDILLSSD